MNTAILTALLSLFTVAAAPDSGASRGEGHDGKRGHAALCEKLACTDAQRTQIDSIREAMRADTQDERDAMSKLKAEMRAAKSAAKPDTAKIDALRAKMKPLHESMKKAREASRAEISKVLTPAQREQFAAMKKAHDGKRGEKGGHGKGKGKRDGGGKRGPAAKRSNPS